jgi:hypothetical protein
MYNSDTELMFPLRVAAQLAGQRGEKWKAIVDQITAQGATTVDQAAFTLLIVRLGGCQDADSFRGMRLHRLRQTTVKRFCGQT